MEEATSTAPDESAVDIGNGVMVPKRQLESISAMSTDACKFARNLLRAVFSKEELTGKSLFGNFCNANRNNVPSPAIEDRQRNAVLGNLLIHLSN